MKRDIELDCLQTIAKNLDFSLRVKDKKSVLIISDYEKEGKSTFIRECAPVLCRLYQRKILIFDCQKERQQKLEKTFSPSNLSHQVIHQTNVKGLSYVHLENLMFLQTLPRPEKSSGLMAYYTEISKAYDLVFINIKTHKRSHETIVPDLPIDSAVLIRSKRSIGLGKTPITLDVCDREVPVIGIVMNEGV